MSKILAGRYEIVEKIGDGGMAVVYKARDKLLNRPVAIKVLRPEYVTDSNFVESFRKESRAAASLTHPNIVSIFDVGKDGNVYYIVMELVEGRPLSDIINEEGPLDYRIVLKISEQIASALSVAHKNNIIHRDVKPHNIMITQDGHAKITDFGIARAVTNGTTVNDNTVKGTVHYFSPEQGRGMYMDERSDLYSLGIVMFEMLTGQVPFDAENAVAVAVMHMNDRMTPPSRIVPGVPPALEQIVMKATEKHQVNRFKNADEMLEALRNVDRLTGGFVNPVIAGAVRGGGDAPASYADGYGDDAYADGRDDYGDGYGDGRYSGGRDGGAGNGRNDSGGRYSGAQDGEYDDGYGTGYPPDGDPDGGYGQESAAAYGASGAAMSGSAGGSYYDEYDEDDEDDRRKARGTGGKRPRKKDENRKYKVIAVIAAIILAAVISYFFIYPKVSDMLDNKPAAEKLKVENVLGRSVDEAKKILETDQGFVVEVGDDVFSSEYAIGLVAEQDPAVSTELEKGGTVTLHVSKGPDVTQTQQPEEEKPAEEESNEQEVPDVVGKSSEDAQYAIKAVGFDVKVQLSDSDKPQGQVIKQDPKGKQKAKKGSTITITVSTGPKAVEVIVPELKGMTLNKATSTLKKLNLNISNIGEEYSDSYKKGTVMWQQHKKGKKLSEGQTVDVKISLGPEDKTTTVSVDIPFDNAPADAFKLTVVLELGDGTENYITQNEDALKANGSKSFRVTGKGTGARVVYYFDDVEMGSIRINFNTKEVG